MQSINLEIITEISIWSILVVALIGLPANILAFIIYSREKFRNISFSIFFKALIISDTLTLLLGDLPKFLRKRFDINIKTLSLETCRLFYLIPYAVPATSAWLIVIISIDRLVSIKMPQRFLFRKKTSFQILACLGTFVYNILLYTQLNFSYLVFSYSYNNMTSLNETTIVCQEISDDVLSWLDLFNSTVVPFLFMLVFTLVTLKHIFDSRKKAMAHQSNNTTVSANTTNISSKDRFFATTSIFLNIFFFITNIPLPVYGLVITYVTNIDLSADYIFSSFTHFIYYLNFASTFFISYFTNSIFHKAFWETLSNNSDNFSSRSIINL